jgi:thioredoxin reductase (NADPH)
MRSAGATGNEETPDIVGAYPRLNEHQIDVLAAVGEPRPIGAGDVLFREGDRTSEFIAILAGTVAVVDGYGSPDERTLAIHGPGRFLGELGLLTGQPPFVTAVVRESGEVLVVPVDELRRLVTQDTDLGDLILRAYLARRSLLIGLGTGLRIVGSRFSPEARRLRDFAARNRVPHRWIDLEKDPQAEAALRELGLRPEETPVVILGTNRLLRNPSNAELARAIGLSAPTVEEAVWDLAVVGAGPAGLAAAVYGASEGLATIVLDAVATGGQAETSPRIENYLGFPAGISGGELADRAVLQAQKFGARIMVPCRAVGLREGAGFYEIELDGEPHVRSRTVLIATGAQYRKLDVPRFEQFEGTSVYYAATQMEAMLCRDDPVVVVGGGNSAGQACLFLAKHAAPVRLLVRGDDLGKDMSRYLVDQIERSKGVEVHLNTEVRELVGDRVLEAVVAEDNRTGTRRTIEAKAMFVFIGVAPGTQWLGEEVALDDQGFVLTGNDARPFVPGHGQGVDWTPQFLESNRRGVFAAGDVRSGSIKRVTSAVGEGAMAVRLVHDSIQQT